MVEKGRMLWMLMRPYQYVKNMFIFLPLFFGLKLFDISLLLASVLAFVAFCLIASAVYIVNDIFDMEEDKKHPKKRYRPLAAGTIAVHEALVLSGGLFVVGFWIMGTLSLQATMIALVYVVMNVAYSLYLKHVAIVDIVIIAVGFVLRIFVGTTVTGLPSSMWIIVMTFLLALFLALAKRRDDVLLFQRTGQKMRKVIDGYNLRFVDTAMTLMAGVVIVAYLMYCVSPDVIARVGSDKLYLTAIFVIVGVLRYMQLTFVEEKSGNPAKVLWRDRTLQVVIGLWIAAFAWILY